MTRTAFPQGIEYKFIDYKDNCFSFRIHSINMFKLNPVK